MMDRRGYGSRKCPCRKCKHKFDIMFSVIVLLLLIIIMLLMKQTKML